MRKTWIKLWCHQWLRGSIRREPIEIRAIFADLLAMAGDNTYGEDGMIQIAEDYGFTDQALANLLNIHIQTWLAAKKRLSNHPDSEENRIEIIPLSQGFAIRILNWPRYQSEYARQRRYRGAEKKSFPSSTGKEKKADSKTDSEEKREDTEAEEKVTQNTEKVTSEVTKKVTELLNILKEFSPYPFNEEADKNLIMPFIIKYPDIDFQRQIERKIQWWQENPKKLKAKKSPRTQLFDFFESEVNSQ